MKEKILWAELSRPEVEQARAEKALVVVPVGSIEQHGLHLPLDTDTNTVTEIAIRAARSLDEPRVLVVPTIAYGLSPHHMDFAGTITLRFDTMVNVVCDVCRSIHHHGFRKILLLNGHGGNSALLNGAAIRLVEEKIYVASMTYWAPIGAELSELGKSPIGGMSHACEMETSLQLHLRPHLVDMASAVAEPIVPQTSFFQRDFRAGGSVSYPLDLKLDSRNGVRGDPTYAEAATGEKILQAAVTKVGQFLREFATIPER
jgi:creatinine amidohydrolase